MTDEQFNKIKKEVDTFIIFDEAKIEQLIINIPKMYQKLADNFSMEMYNYGILKGDFDVVIGDLYKHYKFHDKFSWTTKPEIDLRVKSDAKYVAFNTKLVKQKFIVDYLENAMSNVKGMGFNVKHWVEYKKFMAGLN